MKETMKMPHIKMHYYASHTHLNTFGIVPAGPNVDFSRPHDRDRFTNVDFSRPHDRDRFTNAKVPTLHYTQLEPALGIFPVLTFLRQPANANTPSRVCLLRYLSL
jgi:hypothetical protein